MISARCELDEEKEQQVYVPSPQSSISISWDSMSCKFQSRFSGTLNLFSQPVKIVEDIICTNI